MSRSIKLIALICGLGLALFYSQLPSRAEETAQPGAYGLGQPASAAQIAGWDIDVRPDGLGLPPGEGSVEDGEMLFQEQCAQCHGVFGEGAGRWPVLAGGEGSLRDDRPEKTIGSYWPYATTVWDYIHRAMPFFNPQSLSNNEVYALTAYLLYMNDIVEDDFVASQANLAQVEMPNRGGFFRDTRPDVHNEPCMQNCKDPASIHITWDASALGVTPVEHLQNTDDSDESETPPATVAAAAAPGQAVFDNACNVCHGSGIAGAPKVGDKNAWLERIGQGMQTLAEHAINGYHGKTGYMPAKGGQLQLSDEEVRAAVEFMVQQSQVDDEQF